MPNAYLAKSKTKGKRLVVAVEYEPEKFKVINFGSKTGKTFLDHGDVKKKRAWIARHSVNENWSRDGWLTAGFWARWLLWSSEDLRGAIEYIRKRFGIHVVASNELFS